MSIFVDTSAWYALLDRSDASHQAIADLLDGREGLVLTDHILAETHRLASHRLGPDIADAFWHGIADNAADIEIVGLRDLAVALSIRTEWQDQDFSLIDCTSFAVMQRLRISSVASLDNDFAVYRHGNRRQHAFDVLR